LKFGAWCFPGAWSLVLGALCMGLHARASDLTVSGTRFELDGKPFPYTGLSFFNAIYNTNFNAGSEARVAWLKKFQGYGINVLRIWCQWDNGRGFVDASPSSTMYFSDGSLRLEHLRTLKDILRDTDALGVCVELVLFSHESFRENVRVGERADEKAVAALAGELMPFRNVTFQIWNEHDDARVLPLVKRIKAIDPRRLVTNSPGFSSVLGSDEENSALDYLTPHTARQGSGRHWEIAPKELESLLKKFHKPVVDDEPARNGTSKFGGPKDATSPYDHIIQIIAVWRLGCYPTYHHDMFQTGYGTPACPPSGVPDPEFSPYHKQVFEFLKLREKYATQ
jgi:hypothetical protein